MSEDAGSQSLPATVTQGSPVQARDSDLLYSFGRLARHGTGCGAYAVVCGRCLVRALFAPWIAPHNPPLSISPHSICWIRSRHRDGGTAQGKATYPLGTDNHGRDLLSAIRYGARISPGVGIRHGAARHGSGREPRPAFRLSGRACGCLAHAHCRRAALVPGDSHRAADRRGGARGAVARFSGQHGGVCADPGDRAPPLFETADRLAAGKVANPLDPPPGCTFHRRNPLANQRCRTERPELKVELHGSLVACHAVEEGRIAA